MFKRALLLLSLIAFSISARVTVTNNTNEDLIIAPGLYTWKAYNTKEFTVKKGTKNASDASGVSGFMVRNKKTGQSAGPFTVPGKQYWNLDSVTGTVSKDSNGAYIATVEHKQT